MSEIDIERLKVDADYWDGVGDGLAHWQGEACRTVHGVPRPIKQEWEGGLPPVHGDLACTSGGKCKVLGWDSEREQVAVQWHDGELGGGPIGRAKTP